MMSRMKAGASSFLVKIILGLIVLVFVFWGTGSYKAGQLNRVATVNGTGISVDLYRVEYENLVQELRNRFGGNIPDGVLEMLKVREQALWEAIDGELLLQEAKRLKLQVTDEEIANLISNTPVFQTDGRFDMDLYQNFLTSRGMVAPSFEAQQREMMLISKLYTLALGGIQVSREEALAGYMLQNLRLGVEAALFQPSLFKPEAPTEEAVLSYYEKNKKKYEIEKRFRIAFVCFSPEDFISKVPEIEEEELLNTYENQKERFQVPERVTASHILLTLPPNASEKEVEEAKTRILDLRTQASEGADFATLAREFSECPSASQGGDLGTFTREEMVPTFSDAAFGLKDGEISEPVRTPFGWHLIRVTRHLPAGNQTFEEARGELLVELEEEKAAGMAFDAADDAYDAVLKGADIDEISRDWGIPVRKTGFFGSAGPAEIPDSQVLAERVRNLGIDEVSEAIALGGSVYLITPLEIEEEKIPSLDEIRTVLLQDMQTEAADAMAKAEATAILAKMKAGEALPRGTFTKTGIFGRSGEIPGLGNYPAITQAAFFLSGTEDLPESIITLNDGYAVFRIVERVYPEEKDFEAVREEIENALRVEKQSRIKNQWIKSLREKADIRVEAGFQGTQEREAVEE